MKLSKILLLAFILAAAPLSAQVWRNADKAIRLSGKLTEQAAQMTRRLTSKVTVSQRLWRKPVLTSIEPNIRHFIFTVEPLGQKSGFKGSGFVFAEQHEGKTVLWGASAAHTVRHMGKNVTVTFHFDEAEISLPATVELTGRKFGLNAALIKLPEEVAAFALPVELAEEAVSPNENVFTYGFSEGFFKKTVRSVLFPGSERLLADFPRFGAPKPGFCGSVVLNEQGRAVGIETGGYELKGMPWMRGIPSYHPLGKIARASEIVPVTHLNALLREYHAPRSGARAILLNGIKVGPLETDEFIERIYVLYHDGSFKILERSPLWEMLALDQAIPDFAQARSVQLLINKNREREIVYQVDLTTRKVTREEL